MKRNRARNVPMPSHPNTHPGRTQYWKGLSPHDLPFPRQRLLVAVGVGTLPSPRVGAHIFQASLSYPTQHLFR